MKTFRIGNGYKIWHYSGSLIHEKLFSPPDELWETDWQSALPESIPPFKISKQLVSGIQTTQPQVSFWCTEQQAIGQLLVGQFLYTDQSATGQFLYTDQTASGLFLVYRPASQRLVSGIKSAQSQFLEYSQPQVSFQYTDQPTIGYFLAYRVASHRLVSGIQSAQGRNADYNKSQTLGNKIVIENLATIGYKTQIKVLQEFYHVGTFKSVRMMSNFIQGRYQNS